MKQYQHSKSGISLLEIMMNILFFALLATLCMQIFFKASGSRSVHIYREYMSKFSGCI